MPGKYKYGKWFRVIELTDDKGNPLGVFKILEKVEGRFFWKRWERWVPREKEYGSAKHAADTAEYLEEKTAAAVALQTGQWREVEADAIHS